MSKPARKPTDCVSQNGKAKSHKSEIVAKISRLVRREGLTYEDWRYVSRRVRQKCELEPPKRAKKLPRILNPDAFRRFYRVVDQADDVQHSLMLRLVFYTAVRVSELCNIEVTNVDLENCKIRINQGKGSKDRFVLFGRAFATALRTHIAAHPRNRWLFQTQRNGKYSTRRVQQIVKHYAEKAGGSGHAPYLPPPVHNVADSQLRPCRWRTSTGHGPLSPGDAGRLPARCLG